MSETNIFEQASQQGLRYPSSRGMLDTEQLWSLPMDELDEVGMSFQRQINDAGETESLITKKSSVNPKVKLGLAICKRIIEVRLELIDEAEKAVINKQMKDRIAQIIAEKQDGALQEKSLEELQEMAASL